LRLGPRPRRIFPCYGPENSNLFFAHRPHWKQFGLCSPVQAPKGLGLKLNPTQTKPYISFHILEKNGFMQHTRT